MLTGLHWPIRFVAIATAIIGLLAFSGKVSLGDVVGYFNPSLAQPADQAVDALKGTPAMACDPNGAINKVGGTASLCDQAADGLAGWVRWVELNAQTWLILALVITAVLFLVFSRFGVVLFPVLVWGGLVLILFVAGSWAWTYFVH